MNLEHVKWCLLLSMCLLCMENTQLPPLLASKLVFHTYHGERACLWALTGVTKRLYIFFLVCLLLSCPRQSVGLVFWERKITSDVRTHVTPSQRSKLVPSSLSLCETFHPEMFQILPSQPSANIQGCCTQKMCSEFPATHELGRERGRRLENKGSRSACREYYSSRDTAGSEELVTKTVEGEVVEAEQHRSGQAG